MTQTNDIITFILTYDTEQTFIDMMSGIIGTNDESANFFMIYKPNHLLKILRNYKDGAKFRLLIHHGTQKAKATGIPPGKIINPLLNSGMFDNAKFDFTTRSIEPFKNYNDLYAFDKFGNVIHNSAEIDGGIIDRMILYTIKEGKATGNIGVGQKNSTEDASRKKIVILTAMDLEMTEVKRFLLMAKMLPEEDEAKQMYYEKYDFTNKKGNSFYIYLRVTGKNNFKSSAATASAIVEVVPDYLFYLGIAGKLKDVKIGDVVVADSVENYEPAKDDESGTHTRIFQGHASSNLLGKASSVITDSENLWQKNVKVTKHASFGSPDPIKGRIATGEKVLGSITSDLYNRIRHSCSESIAVETEGGGFYHACNEKQKNCLLIRGISDALSDKGFVETFNSQPYASSCAAAFLFELINLL